jgi:hypothetical protein
MTWESLTDRVLTTFGSGVPRVKVKKYLQEAEEDFALGTKCHIKNFAFMPYSDDDFITLPKDFIELVGNVEYKTKTLERLAHFEDFSRYKTDGNVKKGRTEYFFIRGEKMYLFPACSNIGVISFSYVARPAQLDSATTYKYLQFDDLESDQFYIGDPILGRTSDATATVADRVNVSQKTATLVLSGISGTFQDNEVIVATSNEMNMWLTSYSNNWSTLITNWQDIGLGGMADVRGAVYNYDSPGTSPVIPENYHTYLVSYAKAAIAEDNGDVNSAISFRTKYEFEKEQLRVQSRHKGITGVQTVIDVYGNTAI